MLNISTKDLLVGLNLQQAIQRAASLKIGV